MKMIEVGYVHADTKYRARSKFTTIDAARAFALRFVGLNAEFVGGYAVSEDGGKVTVDGCRLAELFGRD